MEQLIKQIKNLPANDKDRIYRMLWHDYVVTDIISRAEENDTELSDEEVQTAADLYVYEGEYDCNLPYWTNIDNLIEKAIMSNT